MNRAATTARRRRGAHALLFAAAAAIPLYAVATVAQPLPAGPAPSASSAASSASASASASAPPPASASASPSTPTPPEPPRDDADWTARYTAARKQLVDGDFQHAAEAFEQLALTARDPTNRALADNQASLARAWLARGVVFVLPGSGPRPKSTTPEWREPAEPELRPPVTSRKKKDRRTSDELGVLYVNSVLYGIGTGGWTAVAAETQSTTTSILPMLIYTGAATGGVALYDETNGFKYGTPQTIVSSMYLGLEEGLVWTLWNQSRRDSSVHWNDKTIATVIWGSATVGAIAGAIVGETAGTTPGRAAWVGSTALWSGTVLGFATAAIANGNGDERATPALAVGGVGLTAGAIVGALTASSVSPSISRTRYIDLGGLLGGLTLGGVYLIAADKNAQPRPGLGFTAIGVAGGLAAAWAATANMPKDLPAERGGADDVSLSIAPVLGGATLGLGGPF